MRNIFWALLAFSLNTTAQVQLIGDTAIYNSKGDYYTVKHHPEFSNIIIIKDYTAKTQLKHSSELYCNSTRILTSEIKKLEEDGILQKDGQDIFYYQSGVKNEERIYQQGNLINYFSYSETGTLVSKSRYITNIREIEDNFENGKLRYRFPYRTKPRKSTSEKYESPLRDGLDGVFLVFDDNGNVTRSIQFSKNKILNDSCISPIPCSTFIDSLKISHPALHSIADIQPSTSFQNIPIVISLAVDKNGTFKKKIKSQKFYKSINDSILLSNWIDSIKISPQKFLGKPVDGDVQINVILGSKENFKLQHNSQASEHNPLYTFANCEQCYYSMVEIMPEFPGGQKAMYSFIKSKLNYPIQAQMNNISGRVDVQFVINPEGNIINAKVSKSLSPECDAEAMRIVQLMPQWRPGYQDGNPVPVYYTLPIKFALKYTR